MDVVAVLVVIGIILLVLATIWTIALVLCKDDAQTYARSAPLTPPISTADAIEQARALFDDPNEYRLPEEWAMLIALVRAAETTEEGV